MRGREKSCFAMDPWCTVQLILSTDNSRAQIRDPEEVTNKMYGRNIDIEVTLSGSLICARVDCPHSVDCTTLLSSELFRL